ncbi:alpha/beta fold hydrolase [Comamonas testosteroni]|uniref:alpha/beta fold hydrolase n=1 Tax=Comamonas testosteroni TaxID=285 RepID=UPI00265E03FF|nr:alpha/beta fold hydrolase [Comamonas testosteroni]WKL15877.1 alpha/beta fold hydrolase [Comamonas testosteroni]
MVDSHGGRVAWRIFGHGRPLVLLHGGHGTWRHWIRNIQALAEQRMVCVPDMPGYGDSDPTDESTVKALLERLDSSLTILLGTGTRIDLGGFSFGGLMAAHLAASRGDVDRLALLGVVGHGGIRRPKAELLDWRVHAQMGDTQALNQAMRHNLLAHMLHAEASVDEQALQIHTDACLRTRFRSKPISRSGGLQALLSRTAPSLLLVWGEHDVTADPVSLAPALAACHPHCITATLPDAGHWVQYESAAAIDMLLSKWLAAPHLD